jgi:hypothetical protein
VAVPVALNEAKHVAPGRLLEGPNQTEPPDHEWSRDGDRSGVPGLAGGFAERSTDTLCRCALSS